MSCESSTEPGSGEWLESLLKGDSLKFLEYLGKTGGYLPLQRRKIYNNRENSSWNGEKTGQRLKLVGFWKIGEVSYL